MYWIDGDNKSYGPFDIQTDGFPHAGQVVRYFRHLRRVTANQLAAQLGDVSPRWVYIMERDNKVYESMNRRKVLAAILGIPPILLGLGSIEDLTVKKSSYTGEFKMDIAALDERLDFLYEAFNAGINPQNIRPQLDSAINMLSTSKQRASLVLLSKYYRSYSRIERDMQNYVNATEYIEKAEKIAMELNDQELFSIALHSHGWILAEQNKIKQALPYFERGHKIVKEDTTPLAGCSYLDLSLISSQVTQNNKDKIAVERLLDRAEAIADKVPSEKEKDGRLNNEVISTNRAAAYLNMNMLNNATEEIDKAGAYLLPAQIRRNTRLDIIQAKHAFFIGDIFICISCLEKAYVGSKHLNSKHNLAKIQELISNIYKSKYIGMKEVRKGLDALSIV